MLSENDVHVIICENTEKFCQEQPITKREVVIFIYERWKVEISKRFVVRPIDARGEISQAGAFPMEKVELKSQPNSLRGFMINFREAMNRIHPINMFNVADIGFCGKARHQKVRCVVPSNDVG